MATTARMSRLSNISKSVPLATERGRAEEGAGHAGHGGREGEDGQLGRA